MLMSVSAVSAPETVKEGIQTTPETGSETKVEATEEKAKPAVTASPVPPPKMASAEEPKGKFDPEGKSAVSGQKRTGWI